MIEGHPTPNSLKVLSSSFFSKNYSNDILEASKLVVWKSNSLSQRNSDGRADYHLSYSESSVSAPTVWARLLGGKGGRRASGREGKKSSLPACEYYSFRENPSPGPLADFLPPPCFWLSLVPSTHCTAPTCLSISPPPGGEQVQLHSQVSHSFLLLLILRKLGEKVKVQCAFKDHSPVCH